MKSHEDVSVIPAPHKLRRLTGEFVLTSRTKVLTEPENEALAAIGTRLADKLNAASGYQIVSDTSSQPEAPKGTIFLTTRGNNQLGGHEGYTVEVLPRAITVEASTPAGIAHAVQTLRQLFPPEIESEKPMDRATPWTVPAVRIKDEPRFQWRGMLLDSCRHFVGKGFIFKTLDLLAYHKLNRFHWHLTEDQGWRIEIDKYPKLTEIGAYRTDDDGRRYGGFYTKDDVREVVAYAADRGITVVPEIEMPGHCVAAIASYPDLSCTGKSIPVASEWGIFEDIFCAGNDLVFEFLEDVLTEIVELFPGPYIHVGGDEVPPTRWRACGRCRKRVEDEGLGDVGDLQCYFHNRVEKILAALGKRAVGWDEVLCDDLAESTTVQVWRGMEHAATAARLGHTVIASPTTHVYFDYALDKIDLARVYQFDPMPRKIPRTARERILGGECTMWTEYAPRDEIESKLYPRIVALAERLWSPATVQFEDFHRRLQTHYRRLELLGVDYGPESASEPG
jgi:hexosaminidase